ncbi:MAG TPA: L-arabinose isomerase [Gaiellaceae bacterium]|nr:L-arabinose isomerase [Gaiellaceae bacterium]
MTGPPLPELWLVAGAQHLYGEEPLRVVDAHAREVAAALDAAAAIPVPVRHRATVTTPDEIRSVCREASADDACAGLVVWAHTFSPGKMWIAGLGELRRPLLHLHTQFNRDLPWAEIDMDFMNLNQSAHGDRELAHTLTRAGVRRKTVAGHWSDARVAERVGTWARAACGFREAQSLSIARFGDNMHGVAVTEGDKVEAQLRLGISVDGYGVGELVRAVADVADADVDSVVGEYGERYELAPALRPGGDRHGALRDAAKIETGLRSFLDAGGFRAFTDTFEDLGELPQLPGIAAQRLMADGYGFGAEGDWKAAALLRVAKVMCEGLPGGSSFMEDYTYDLGAEPAVLGAHMLEVCPSIAEGTPSCEIHPLSIGGKADPVRLVFTAHEGAAVVASLVDLGDRLRLLVNEVDVVAPPQPLPKLPVARAVWKPKPDLATAAESWLMAGGSHHTVLAYPIGVEAFADFADMAGIELVVIDEGSRTRDLEKELRWNRAWYGR